MTARRKNNMLLLAAGSLIVAAFGCGGNLRLGYDPCNCRAIFNNDSSAVRAEYDQCIHAGNAPLECNARRESGLASVENALTRCECECEERECEERE